MAGESKSIMLGFHVCELCGGKSHVKRKDEPGKRAYNHCMDANEVGCRHSTHCTNSVQEKLLLEKMRPAVAVGVPTPTPSEKPEPVAAVLPTPSPMPSAVIAPRRSIFSI